MGELAEVHTVAGFLFVDDEAPDHLKAAVAGARVTLPSSGPPYILVSHTLERVLPTRWPGRLFRAEVVPPATDEERAAMARAAGNLRPDAGYTRAIAVDVLEEISPSVLFGPHGDAVIRVLAAGMALDGRGARGLASARHHAADREYGRAWDRWLAGQPNGGPYLGRDHASTLSIPGAGPFSSPIGDGFSLVWRAVGKSAGLRGGEGAFGVDDEGDRVLLNPWWTAGAALLDAAMAFGAPRLLDDHTATVLTTAWSAVFEAGGSGLDGAAPPRPQP
ncbi:hypothetical protein [Sphaerisporangium sp. TRM90804]|uniref:hypothetical protein n=1 Tax=Sphaerisporangium sp. TRM90804 TaxID=3031113 RepID=UPI00244D790E|nr:hypothetical protein [Sphaerisporangium sp. TRM90804]MDH2428429.1 hypothetical protein [Sphaerisporangium sp. TRM90804]